MTTKRFDNAVRKLYTAFHEGTLNAWCCEACAVGNILGHGKWTGGYGGSIQLTLDGDNNSGYSFIQLGRLERIFIDAHEDELVMGLKNSQFNGLCAVIEYLSQLDGISNPMEYKKLFEIEEGKPKYELV